MDESGPAAIVCVHGIGMSHRSFRRLARRLGPSSRVLAIDLPGFGGARSPRRRLGIAGHADAVAARLRGEGLCGCTVIGQSMGTQVAVELAHRHPALVDALVLIGPVVDDRRPGAARQLAALLRDSAHESPRMNAVVLSDYLRSVPQYLRELRPMLDYPMLARLAQLAIPVLVVRGSEDRIARHDWALRVTDAAARGTLVEPPGPHHVQEHAPAAVATAIARFLAARSQERAS
jgi:pimeloyl-ACP methyl ester carboxylesterase